MYFYRNKVDVFGTVITCLAVPNQAVTGPCRPQFYGVLRNTGMQVTDSHIGMHSRSLNISIIGGEGGKGVHGLLRSRVNPKHTLLIIRAHITRYVNSDFYLY